MVTNQNEGFRELASWMQTNGVGIRALAQRSGLNRTQIFNLVHGRTRTCSVRVARAIARATHGEVGLAEIEAYEARRMRKDTQFEAA